MKVFYTAGQYHRQELKPPDKKPEPQVPRVESWAATPIDLVTPITQTVQAEAPRDKQIRSQSIKAQNAIRAPSHSTEAKLRVRPSRHKADI